MQEETQGQGEEEEREAETHRLPPVSVRRGGVGPRDGKEAGPEGSPASRGQWWGRGKEAQSSLGGQNRELLEILGPRKPQGTLVLVLT